MLEPPYFSIIIPVYNRERTIRFCLESILNQTYKNWEVIVVDDGSSDSTYSVLKEYHNKDNRFSIATQENMGPSRARNLGIDMSIGRYIIFIDSDDAVGRDLLECLYKISQRGGYDLLMYQNRGIIVKDDAWREVCSDNIITEYTEDKIMSFLFSYPYDSKKIFVWNKLFDANIIRQHQIRFKEDVNLGEDQIFLCSYLKYTKSFAFTSKVLYYNLSVEGMSPGLGGKSRTSEDYLYNQMLNYDALITLYDHCHSPIVREYASNYIIDRVITRIGYRNVPSLFSVEKNKKFEAFIKHKIVPVVKREYSNISTIHDPYIKYLAILIVNGRISSFVFHCRLQMIKGKLLRRYHRLRYLIIRWLKY